MNGGESIMGFIFIALKGLIIAAISNIFLYSPAIIVAIVISHIIIRKFFPEK
jgi:FtsH-binding integral membrane protein